MKSTRIFSARSTCVTSMMTGLILALTGCVSPTPILDAEFGKSVSLIKAQQTLNPAASRNTNPVNGLDGVAAKSAYDAYQKSYKNPEPPSNAFTIGIGGGR